MAKETNIAGQLYTETAPGSWYAFEGRVQGSVIVTGHPASAVLQQMQKKK